MATIEEKARAFDAVKTYGIRVRFLGTDLDGVDYWHAYAELKSDNAGWFHPVSYHDATAEGAVFKAEKAIQEFIQRAKQKGEE